MTCEYNPNLIPRRFLASVALAMLLLPAVLLAQSWSEPVAPALFHDRVEIGPVDGFTTIWHPAPRRTAVPLGATVRLRVSKPCPRQVVWTGAWEIAGAEGCSTAEYHFAAVGPHVVSVAWENAPGAWTEEAAEFEVIDLLPTTAAPAGVSVSAVHLSPGDGGTSIAALGKREGEDHYWTSINRSVILEADVQPAAFAPLIEWRLDGRPQRHLGSPLRLEIYTARPHVLSAGPVVDEKQVLIDIYSVRITGPEDFDEIPAGASLTFTAVTDPPGFEDDITWQAFSEFGAVDPSGVRHGPEFTVWFEPTFAVRGPLRGVQADNAKIGRRQPRERPADDSFLACYLATREDLFEPGTISFAEEFCEDPSSEELFDCSDGTPSCLECHECENVFTQCMERSCTFAGPGFGPTEGLPPGARLAGGCSPNLDVIQSCSLAHSYCLHRCRRPDIVHAGTWCCKECNSSAVLSCTGCKAVGPAQRCDDSIFGTAGRDIRLDCPGRTTEHGEAVNCY